MKRRIKPIIALAIVALAIWSFVIEPNQLVVHRQTIALPQWNGRPPLTTAAHQSNRISATIDDSEDPRDVYRIWIPPHRVVRVSVAAGGDAAARIWGPRTAGIQEGIASRRRDLKGQSVTAGKTGFNAYVEVLLTGASTEARYTLSVTASKR